MLLQPLREEGESSALPGERRGRAWPVENISGHVRGIIGGRQGVGQWREDLLPGREPPRAGRDRLLRHPRHGAQFYDLRGREKAIPSIHDGFFFSCQAANSTGRMR